MKTNFSILLLVVGILTLGFSIKRDPVQITEFMDPGKMRINGKLPLMTSIIKLEAISGKPDSVTKITDWDGICQSGIRDENSVFRHYKGSAFESYNDSVSTNTIDVREGSKLFIQYGNIRLDSKTTLLQLKKIFPKSCADISEVTTNGFIGKLEMIGLAQDPDPTFESQWILLFQHGKLVRIDYWLPC